MSRHKSIYRTGCARGETRVEPQTWSLRFPAPVLPTLCKDNPVWYTGVDLRSDSSCSIPRGRNCGNPALVQGATIVLSPWRCGCVLSSASRNATECSPRMKHGRDVSNILAFLAGPAFLKTSIELEEGASSKSAGQSSWFICSNGG